jgi:hypothetical protein
MPHSASTGVGNNQASLPRFLMRLLLGLLVTVQVIPHGLGRRPQSFRARGIDLIAADSPSSFLDDTPTARLIRQVLGAVSEFEKAMLVAKLRGARDRKRQAGMKVERRKSIAETKPETIELARKLARARPKGGNPSLCKISAALAEAGDMTKAGNPYAATAVKLMLNQK